MEHPADDGPRATAVMPDDVRHAWCGHAPLIAPAIAADRGHSVIGPADGRDGPKRSAVKRGFRSDSSLTCAPVAR